MKIKAFKKDGTTVEINVTNNFEIMTIANRFERWEYIYK